MTTTTMLGSALAALLVTLSFSALAAADPIPGRVDETTKTTITVNGQRYTIESTTTLEDQSGARIAVAELVPGTAVEIELDGSHLVDLRAAVIR